MLQEHLFDFIATKLERQSGICLSKDKTYLLESRLQPVARQHGFTTVEELLQNLMQQNASVIMHDVVQAMTTNETMFFRDKNPYERFTQNILPNLKAHDPQRKDLRIWSAACSTGQEPYSLALSLQEEMRNYPGYQFHIIGSDLCESAVEKAKEATYTQFEVQRGLPIQLLVKYFQQREGNLWQLNDTIRQMVQFKVHNLLDPSSSMGPVDVIFCRNVLIYFDEPVKERVMAQLIAVLRKPGYVVLGSAESITGITDALVALEGVPGVYCLK